MTFPVFGVGWDCFISFKHTPVYMFVWSTSLFIQIDSASGYIYISLFPIFCAFSWSSLSLFDMTPTLFNHVGDSIFATFWFSAECPFWWVLLKFIFKPQVIILQESSREGDHLKTLLRILIHYIPWIRHHAIWGWYHITSKDTCKSFLEQLQKMASMMGYVFKV